MTEIQALRFPREKSSQLGPLRTFGGLDIHEQEGQIWLRVTATSDEIQSALKRLPAATAYRVLDDGQLCRMGSLVPEGFLPDGPWERLPLWMQVELPQSSLPGQIPDRVPLKLVRAAQPRDANLLLTSMEQWLTYGSAAPQVRLDHWHFAVSSDREVLIRGVPLPPIPGKHLALANGIAVPCGWHWSPAVDGDVLARTFALAKGDMILWRDEGRIERIAENQFVRATRSAIRLSAETR